MAVKCPYCSQINSKGVVRCIYCTRYIDTEKEDISEEELLMEQAYDFKKGIRLNLDLYNNDNDALSREEFIKVTKVIGIVVLLISIFIIILKALFY